MHGAVRAGHALKTIKTMSYLSKYTGAQVDALLDKCDELPTSQELNDVLGEMQGADLSGFTTTATASTRSVRATLGDGTVKSVSLPAATTAAAGMMSAADKGTLDGLAGLAAPLYLEGAMYVAGNNFLAGAELLGSTQTETLTAQSTGLKKKVWDRFMSGVPCCLMVPVCDYSDTDTATTCVPFVLHSTSRLVTAGRQTLVYRNAMVMQSGSDIDIKVTVYRSAGTVSLSHAATAQEELEDIEPLLPFMLGHFSVKADGTVSPSSSAVAYGASSTGELKRLYERMQKGNPPSIGVMMTNADGSQTVAWAHLDQITGSGKTRIYLSGSLANGTFSGKQLRVNISADKVMCSLVNASS